MTGALRILLAVLGLCVLSLQASVPRPGTFTLEVGGQRLHCQRGGRGPDLLLLHGGLGSSEDFEPLRDALEKDFTVLSVDRSGHGRSTDPGRPFTYAAMAAETKSVLDHLGIARTDVLGWSDGGVVGYHLASRHPRLVGKLVALGANVRVDGLNAETRSWLERAHTPEALEADLPDVARAYRRLSPNPWQLRSFLARSRDLWLRDPYLPPGALADIQAPVLLVVGDRQDIPLNHIQEIRAAIKGASICVLPCASHFLLKQKSRVLLPIVQEFLGAKGC